MSEKVETRVVKMEFDNAKFERDVKQSINTLDKFDKRLRFEGVSDSVEKVTKKITAFEVAAVTAIANISNRITNLGIRMIKSLSIDNISSGWDKFGEKTVAVATMAAQKIKIAGKAIDDYSKKMEVINQQLEKLNWFTDETSYNFTDMVDSIGKFTAAGQDLDKSVSAMMGIANWAALSGQNASKASSAMYQLAQAMGKGYVQLIDWKSIQNLSMDTIEFREAVLETAVSMGQLTKEADKFITKTGKKFTISQFAEELNSKWFTTDVLVNTLGKYSAAIERIYEISQETGWTASQIMKRYASELDEFGLKAFKAAQEARTLADALNSVKDAVSTGWMNTAEKIFGGYDESKELFTDLANELYDVFAEGGNFRNEILGLWNDLGGRADLFEHGDTDQGAFWNIYDSIVAVRNIIKDSWNTIFPKSAFESYNDQVTELANNFKIFTDRLKNYTATIKTALEDNQKLSNIFTGLFSLIKIGALALNGIRYSLDPILTLAKNTLGYITDRLSYLVSHTSKMEGVINTINSISIKLHDTIESIIDVIDPRAVLGGILNFLKDIVRTIKDNAPLESFTTTFKEFFESLKENGANAENFKRIMNGLTSIFDILTKTIIKIVEISSKYLLPVLNVILTIASKIVSFSAGLITSILALIGDLFVMLDEVLSSKSTDEAGNSFNNFLDNLSKNVENMKPLLKSFVSIFSSFIDLLLIIPTLLDNISKSINGKSLLDNLSDMINRFKESIDKVVSDSSSGDNEPFAPLVILLDGLITFFKGLGSVIGGAITLVGETFKNIGILFKNLGTFLKESSQGIDSKALDSLGKMVLILGGILVFMVLLTNVMWAINSRINPIAYALDNISDTIAYFGKAALIRSVGDVIASIAALFISIGVSISLISKSMDINKLVNMLTTLIKAISIILLVFMTFKQFNKIMSSEGNPFAMFTRIKESSKSIGSSKDVAKENMAIAAKLGAISTMISSIANAMIKIGIAFSILGKVKDEDMWKGLTVLGIFALIVGGVLAFSLIPSKKGGKAEDTVKQTKDIKKVGTLLLGIGVVFKTLAKALKTISDIDVAKLWRAVGAMSTVIAVVTAAIALITILTRQSSKSKGINKKLGTTDSKTSKSFTSGNGTGIESMLIGIAVLFLSISTALKSIGKMDPNQLKQGMDSIITILSVITACIVLLSRFTGTKTKSGNVTRLSKDQGKGLNSMMIGIIAMITSMTILVSILGKMDPNRLKQGMISLGVLVGIVTAMMVIIGKLGNIGSYNSDSTKGLIKTMISLVAFIGVMIGFIALLSSMDLSKSLISMAILGGLITALTISLVAINKSSKNISSKTALANLIALAGISSALVAFGAAMMLLSGIEWTTILAASLGFSACILAVVGSLVLLEKSGISVGTFGTFALSILAMSGAMIVFAQTIKAFENISWSTVGKGLLTLAVCFGMLIGTSFALEKLGPSIFMVGLGLAAMAGAMYLFTYLLPIMQEGLQAFAAFFDENTDAIVECIKAIATILVTSLLSGFEALIDYITLLLPKGFELVKAFIFGLLDVIKATGPDVIETIVSLLDFLIKTLADHAVSIATNLMTVLLVVLSLLADNMGLIGSLLIDMFLKLLEVIRDKMPQLISAIVDTLIVLVTELFKNLGRLLDIALPLLFNFIIDLIGKLVKYIVPFAAAITKLMIILIASVLRLTLQASAYLASELIAFFGGLILLIVQVIKGMNNVIFEALKYIFVIIITTLSRVLRVVYPMLVIAGRIIGLSLVAGILDALDNSTIGQILNFIGIDVGKFVGKLDNQIADLTDDLKKYGSSSGVEDAIRDAGNDIMSTVSNVTNFMGDITKQGLDQINNTVNNSLDGISETVSTFSNQIGSYMAEGLEQGAYENQQTAEDAGAAISDAALNGARERAGIHSPSTEFIEIGKYMCEGLVIGIEENQNVVINKATELINRTIIAAHEAINNAINGNVLTITPVMDLSSIRAGASDISQIMSNVSGGGIHVSGSLASAASSELRSDKSSSSSTVINNGGDTYNATFNVTTNNPQSFSEDVDKELQHQRLMSKLAKGGAY